MNCRRSRVLLGHRYQGARRDVADLAGKLYPLRREIEQQWTDEEGQASDNRKQWRPSVSLVAALGVALLVASIGIGYFLR